MKSRRQLTHEEHELWGHVVKSVKRLKPAAKRLATKPVLAEPQASPPPPPGKMAKAPRPKAAPAAPPPAPPKPAIKPLVALEPKAKRRLNRGQSDVAARIDLHGMRQHEAHDALVRFISEAHARDMRLVLVITGKGKASADGIASEREVGVLRRLTPHWLAEPALRHIVLGYESAGARHGGDGAIYVRIRKRGPA